MLHLCFQLVGPISPVYPQRWMASCLHFEWFTMPNSTLFMVGTICDAIILMQKSIFSMPEPTILLFLMGTIGKFIAF